MARPIYAFQSDELGALATVTLATGTASATYPVTKVQNYDPFDYFLTTDTGGIDIVWDSGAAVDVQVFSLHHHNIPAGTNVRIQRHASNSWGAPTMDVAVTIAAYPNTGLPFPVGIDLTGQAGYSGAGFRYTRLHVPSSSLKTGIGSALLWGAKRQTLRQLNFPIMPHEQQTARLFKTAGGVTRTYRIGVRERSLTATLLTTNADFANFLALFRAAEGNHKVFLWWMDTTGSDAWLANFLDDTTALQLAAYNHSPVTFAIQERANGLALPTA